ncbi:MAG TPA: recombinase family protein, partial [Phycisphaerales bacterium]|nr:recombinase family protein [Phycisphaerales bacterium]
MIRAALYLRVSTSEQAERGIPDQELDCRAYAEKRGWSVVQSFTDAGASAFKQDAQRPGFAAARAAAERGEYDVLLVWAFDRISRREDLDGILGIAWEFEKNYGVKIESATQELPEDAMVANMLRLMIAAQSNLESRNKSERSKRGAARRLREGKHAGRAAYGYRPDGAGGLALDPDAATVVRRIFDQWNAGSSQSEIARRLTQDGIPTARGGAVWEQATVGVILKNRAYLGEIKTPEGYSPGAHEPIVTATQFDLAQRRMNSGGRKREGGREAREHLLARLLRCGDCGAVMRARNGPVQPTTGQRYATYTCPNANGKYGATCGMRPVSRSLVDQAVLQHFADHVVDLDRTREAFRTAQEGRLDQLKAEASAMARQYTAAKTKFEKSRDLAAAGAFDPEDLAHFRTARDAAKEASDAALDRYNAAKAAKPPDDVEARVVAALSELHSAVADGLGSSDVIAALRAQLEKVFERFELHRGELNFEDMDLPNWPPGSNVLLPKDPGPDDQAHLPHDPKERTPDDLVTAKGWTLFPVLRTEVIAELETSYRPVAATLPISASAAEDDEPDGGSTAGLQPKPSGPDDPASSRNSITIHRDMQGNPPSQNYNEGLATKSSAPRSMPRTAA